MDFQTWFETLGVSLENGYTSLSFKINKSDLGDISADRLAGALIRYIAEHSEGETKFVTIGEHENGKNENEHFHINFAIPTFRKTSNESRRRTSYLDKTEGLKLDGLSCKIDVINTSITLEQCLKYPWKERKYVAAPDVWDYIKIPKEVRLYMIESAHAMFLASVEQQRKKQRASERSTNLLEIINDLAGTISYGSYQEFKEKICREFFEPLELNEYPDMNNFKKALEKVAVKRKIVPYHYFI